MDKEKKFDKIKYNNQYNGNKYDRVSLMLPKGQRDILKDIAIQKGYRGITGLVNDLIKMVIEHPDILDNPTTE